ncbi:hypothetical protein SeLEV6574_g01143 [Synchytrium endobioticum]|uniref:Lysosomal dipeptide transporter MFSD1 n=1 Tax=Synchytrium endobioticum TaxID=286115 RepID=A0A507DEL3_9FUNG|nr:hypothetical protein SeLEV6574_g01143 [Synchytrium endobioticum]
MKSALILATTSIALSGAYYVYDQPAAINKMLQIYLQPLVTENDYQYALNFMYAIYSIPNIILPFIAGAAMDRVGTDVSFVFLTLVVTIGQLFFTMGVGTRSLMVMYLGRLLLGIGGESAGVAQSRITTDWFGDKYLGFALGVNVAIARAASVLNDVLSPWIAIHVSVPFSALVGLVVCGISSLASLYALLAPNQKLYEHKPVSEEVPNGSSHEEGDTDVVVLHPVSLNQERTYSERTLALDTDDHQPFLNDEEAVVDKSKGSGSSFLGTVSSFPLTYWQICIILVTYYGAVLPFNTIHAAFLQIRYYPNDPQTASQIMSIPDVISVVIGPLAAGAVDYTGRRIWVMGACGGSMVLVHLLLGAGSIASPTPLLIVLGLAYSFLITTWACIPLLVEDKHLGTAFGFASSLINTSEAIIPFIVAWLINIDPST